MHLSALLLPLVATLASSQTVYLIRHGEKPPNDGNGLSVAGMQRAQCLRSVFGASSAYNIGYVLAQTPKDNGKRTRPLMTVQPVAADLGLSVDTSCDRDDPACVKAAVTKFGKKGTGKNVLICWEHDALTDIVKELGMKKAPEYPDDSFNLIWTDPSPYSTITATTSENCPGLDS